MNTYHYLAWFSGLRAQLQFQAEKKPGLFSFLRKCMPIPRKRKVVTQLGLFLHSHLKKRTNEGSDFHIKGAGIHL